MSILNSKTAAVVASMVALGRAQAPGTQQTETHPALTWSQCTTSGCTEVSGSVVIDANWRWTHYAGDGNYTNCYTGNEWSCGTSEECTSDCVIEGADYASTYGVTTSGNAVTLAFETENSSGINYGSRLYLMADDDENYQMFTPNGNEISFDVDNSQIGCGLNGAVYFVSMAEDGGMSTYDTNTAGAAYGVGYCDSQCARDLKWVGGLANADGWTPSDTDENSGVGGSGACCAEMDLWEANRMSFALTPHPCSTNSYTVCTDTDCGGTYSEDRYAGVCDPDGCDLNPFRHGNTDFYGEGMTVDTTKKFTVVTQFNGAGTSLDSISQYFIQDGVKIEVPASQYVDGGSNITEAFCEAAKPLFEDNEKFFDVGGLDQMADATGNPMVLVMSLWDDAYASMLWLDGVKYPTDRDASEPGVPRGTCAVDGSSDPDQVRVTFADATVTYSNIKFGPLNSTFG